MSFVKDLLLLSLALIFAIKYIQLRREISEQKEYFIQTLSHDLRVSTIAQLRGLELLQKASNDFNRSELISYINDSCRFTLDMISMLLNTYRYEKGEQILNYEKCSINDLIVDSCNSLNNFSKEKNIIIQQVTKENIYADVDKNSIQKLLSNLITTAICYGENNSKIFISNSILENKDFKIVIGYKGKPLSEEECKRMFSNNSRFSTVGHGIRMHLCKKIIDFHK